MLELIKHYLLCQLHKYWIMATREEIAEWEKECAAFIRRKTKYAKQIMAPLPLN